MFFALSGASLAAVNTTDGTIKWYAKWKSWAYSDNTVYIWSAGSVTVRVYVYTVVETEIDCVTMM